MKLHMNKWIQFILHYIISFLNAFFIESLAADVLAARKFYEEALLMRDFDHVHILRLIGIAQDDDGLPLVVLPFMQNGDLLTYIRCGDNVSTIAHNVDKMTKLS